MDKPILSIVIANYNYGRFIEAAIKSVIDQGGFDKCELIVVDGGSTDNSIEVIKKYSDKIAWWVSEKDRGQSDAFNKGFAKAKGKYLTWLNADDILVPGCLKKIVRELENHPDCEWFTGNFYRFSESSKKVIGIGWGPHWYPMWLQKPNSPLVVFGPSTIFSKEIFERVGRIDEKCHFMMDTDLWMRFMAAGIKQRRINTFIWAFRMHEESKTAEFGSHRLSEEELSKFRAEAEYCTKKVGYKMSRMLRLLTLFFRVIDGSIVRRIWYKCRGVV